MTLLSPWGEKLNRKKPLFEYPRMQLQRGSFTCLNGVWEYQITDGKEPSRTSGWKNILVPFALGSKLSGTDDQLLPGQVLWYRRYFNYHLTNDMTLMNFEAVDQCCTVYINGIEAGGHNGGYAPFSVNVTGLVKEHNEVLVKVTDESDQGIYAYGKQKLEHGTKWYTPSSGIWQTVWMEDLPPHAVQDIKITPDYDNGRVYLQMAGTFSQAVITVFEGNQLVHRGITSTNDYTIPMENFRSWSPSDPFLYNLYIQTEDETVKSYFGMRKFSAGKDSKGMQRFMLNNRPLFFSGLLDQGYSVDGLMTYPSEEAMIYELRKVKQLGFNMLRKHIKQECRRWYYLCDLLGILVMQDMPSGGGPYDFMQTAALPTIGIRTLTDRNNEKLGRTDKKAQKVFYEELDQMLDTLYNCTCIFSWVPFNEGWGQFDSKLVCEHIRNYDSTRLIDAASGWHDQGAGDFNSRHCYFRPFRIPAYDGRLTLLSEFGGYNYLEYGHSEPVKVYGYKKYTDKLKLSEGILKAFERDVLNNIPKGLTGCIFTQLSDVEDECNGLFTADRRVIKVDERQMRRMNEKCIRGVR